MAETISGRREGYKDLIAYQKAYEMALETCRLTGKLPKEELYGFTSQIRRAAVSIPSNICEGYRRCSRNDYLKFLRIAHGSCAELLTQLSLCHDLELMDDTDYRRLYPLGEEVSRLLSGLIHSLRNREHSPIPRGQAAGRIRRLPPPQNGVSAAGRGKYPPPPVPSPDGELAEPPGVDEESG